MTGQCRLRGALVALGVSLWSLTATAGYREDSLVDFMELTRSDEHAAVAKRLEDLHGSYQTMTLSGDRRLVTLALGVQYLDRNPRLALQYLTSAELACRDGEPLLPIIRYYLAQVRLKSGNYKDAMTTASDLLEKDVGSGWSRLLFATEIEAAYGAADYEHVVKAFEEYTKTYSFSRRQETLAHYAAVAYEKRGDTTRANEVLEELARGYPSTDESRWAFGRLQDLACDKTKLGRAKYRFSTRLLQHLSRNAILDTGIREFIVANLDGPLTQDDGATRTMSLSEKADFFFKARFYREALVTTRELYEIEHAKPDSKLLPEIIFDMGRIHLRLWEPMMATRYFSQFIAEYPKHPYMARALEHLGDALRNAGLPLAAADSYASAAGQKDSRLLRWHHFWSLYRGQKFAEALALLEQPDYVQPRDGDDQITISYWHARVLQRLGRKGEADVFYAAILANNADSYYANLVAAIRPDLVEGSKAVASGPNESARSFGLAAKLLAPPSDESQPESSPDLRLVDQLLRVGMTDAARVQLAGLKWNTYGKESAFAAVSKVALSLDDYNPTRRIKYSTFSALRTLPNNWWDYITHQTQHADEWKIYYPMAFNKIVTSVASKIRINPFLILSVIRTESFYNKDARSGVGAQGLMQLMPYTAMKIATLLNDQGFDALDLGKPEVNIGYGGYYLDKLLRYYGDNPFLAVAAYNGGPVAVNQWMDSCRDCAADEFVESIQYRETRRYVREVMRNYAQYIRIYTGGQALGELPRMPGDPPDGEEIF